MDKYTITFQTWNKIAKIYQDKFMDLDLYDATYDFICQSIDKHHAKLLEIGCGPGNITRYLLHKRPDFQVEGIDIAPNMVELAQKNNPTAVFRVMDVRKINQFKTRFDGIIGGFCLPYLSDEEAAELVVNAHFLLEKGGILYLSFVEGNPAESDYKTNSYGDSVFFYFHELEELIRTTSQVGFLDEVKVFKIPYARSATEQEIHTVLVVQKK